MVVTVCLEVKTFKCDASLVMTRLERILMANGVFSDVDKNVHCFSQSL